MLSPTQTRDSSDCSDIWIWHVRGTEVAKVEAENLPCSLATSLTQQNFRLRTSLFQEQLDSLRPRNTTVDCMSIWRFLSPRSFNSLHPSSLPPNLPRTNPLSPESNILLQHVKAYTLAFQHRNLPPNSKHLFCSVQRRYYHDRNADMGKDKEKGSSFQLKVPKGTRDWAGSDLVLRDHIFSAIADVFRKHGAVCLDTPVFELTEILAGKYGLVTNAQAPPYDSGAYISLGKTQSLYTIFKTRVAN